MKDQEKALAEVMTVNPGHEAVDILHVDRREEPRDLRLLQEAGGIVEDVSITALSDQRSRLP
jgi:hypothetical protein